MRRLAMLLVAGWIVLATNQVSFGLVHSQSIDLSQNAIDYDFPDIDGGVATIAGSLFKVPKKLKYHTIKLKDPERPKRKRRALKFRYYPAQGKSDGSFTFLLGGIGATVESNLTNLVAEKISAKGKHALVVPSVFLPRFAEAFSSTGYVGNIADDSKDLYRALELVTKKVNLKFSINPESYNMIGISLGALTAAHIGSISVKTLERLQFQRILIINNPVDLLHGLRYLDEGRAAGDEIGFWREIKLLQYVIKIFKALPKTEFMNIDVFQNIVSIIEKFTEGEVQSFIADSLSSSLAGVITVSQEAYDQGVFVELPPKSSVTYKYVRKERRKQIAKMGFEQYVNGLMVPYYQTQLNRPDYTIEQANYNSSLYGLRDYISSSNNIFLMHNEDDFLLKPSDIDWLKSAFGERAYFFPRGGHVGNLWYPENMKVLNKFLDKLIINEPNPGP